MNTLKFKNINDSLHLGGWANICALQVLTPAAYVLSDNEEVL